MTYTRENGGAAALAWAETKAGMPYQWGGTGDPSYDCSGLFQAAYERVGVALPRTSEEQCTVAPLAGFSLLEPGDGVFFRGAPSEAPPGHVGLYVGRGTILAGQHAWTADTHNQSDIFFNAPYTDDPYGIRYDYFDPATLLFATRPANLLPAGPLPIPEGEPVDDQFICPNPSGNGDFFCSWSTRIAVGIPNGPTRDMLAANGAKRIALTAAEFSYFKRSNWSTP